MVILPRRATEPTMYFIGVTTAQSSIMKVFPKWADALGIKAVIKGIDLEIHADPQDYVDCVEFIQNDPLSVGALVTTHKLDLFHATKHLFDTIDPYADKLEEISSISKRGQRLCCHAKDPISSGLALESFIPAGYWKDHRGEVLLLGAGGSSLAISLYLTREEFGENVPSKIIIANRSQPRLETAKRKLKDLNQRVAFEFVYNPLPEENDMTLKRLKPYSLIVNATGLGKDMPGSPLTDNCRFPENSLVWEINYRGDLIFMRQALGQKQRKNLAVEDGWTYFIHGWTQVIGEVFNRPIAGDDLELCSKIAMEMR